MGAILSESWIISTLLKAWQMLVSSFKRSYTVYIAVKLKALFEASLIFRCIGRIGYISELWERSVFYKAIHWLLLFPENFFKLLYRWLERWFVASLSYRVLLFLVKRLHLLVAAMLFIFLVVPFRLQLAGRVFEWRNQFALLMILGLMALLVIKPALTGEGGIKVKSISFYAFIFAAMVAFGTVFSGEPGQSFRFFIFYINAFLLVFLVIGSVHRTDQLRQMITIILMGVTITGLYGIWQAIVGVPVDASLTDLQANPDMPGRIYSTIENTNDYAEILVMLLPFYLAAGMYTKTFGRKLFYFLLAMPPLLALLLTYARTSWIGFAFAVFICLLFINKKLIPLLLILLLCSIPVMPKSIFNRVQTIFTGDSSIKTRFDIFKTVIPMIKDHWLMGIGLGTDVFKKTIIQYPLLARMVPAHSHNIVLQVWLETGIIGLLSFLGFILNLFAEGIRKIKQLTDSAVRYVIIVSVAGISGVIVTGLGEYIWHTHRVMLIFWAVVGILIASVGIAKKEMGNTQDVRR